MTKNNLLSEKLKYTGDSQTPTHLHLCRYSSSELEFRQAMTMAELAPSIDTDAICWIQIHGLQNIRTIEEVCSFFNIDFLTTQDILNSNHLTKIEEHEAYNVVLLKQLSAESKNAYLPQQCCIVQGKHFVLTFVEHETDFFTEIQAALENNVLKIRNRTSDFLLSVMLNSVMANFMSVISTMEDELEDMEENLLTPESRNGLKLEDMQPYRRNVRLIKKCILPLKEQFGKLFHTDNDLLHDANRPFFNDVNDHLQFVIQTLDGCRDMISALVDLYLSNNDQRMNSIMKQLTIVSTIFIPLTFLAGIWGMNFHNMPELNWKYGYLLAWALMLAVSFGVWLFFRRKKWY